MDYVSIHTMRTTIYLNLIALLALVLTGVKAQTPKAKGIDNFIKESYTDLEQFYKQLHQHPELSLQEEKTATLIAAELKGLGFEVTEGMGAHNLAGVYRNGKGPTILIRTDMDALPLEEKTNLPYASTIKGVNAVGDEVGVMHACGHDIHMTVFVGTARALIANKNQWKGTLVMVAQSAEESGVGADLFFEAGLYDKIAKPDYAIALHVNPFLAAGKIGYRENAFLASVDMIDIKVFGEGGHGAAPHTTKDPIVLAAQMVSAFQTIVSREIDPLQPAVVTVGSIHGGAVHNVIPDEVDMQLTIRSYSPEVRNQIIASLHQISEGLASAAGLPKEKMPVITIREPFIPATINDARLTQQLMGVFRQELGKENVQEMPLYMFGEDFSQFGIQAHKVPICMFWLGAVDPLAIEDSKKEGAEPLPSLHSPLFAPLPEPTIKTGIQAMATAAMELLNR